MSLPFTRYLIHPGDHRWLVGRGEPVNPEPVPERPEPVRAADDPDASWLTADGKAFDPPDDVAADIHGLPPHRARLAQFVAWRRLVAGRIANLDAGIAELNQDIARVTEARDRLRGLRAADAARLGPMAERGLNRFLVACLALGAARRKTRRNRRAIGNLAPPGQFSANWPGRSSATSRSIIPSRRSSQQAPPGRIGVQPGVIERGGSEPYGPPQLGDKCVIWRQKL